MCHLWSGLPEENLGSRMDRIDVLQLLADLENAVDHRHGDKVVEFATSAARKIRQAQRESINMSWEVVELVLILADWEPPKKADSE